MQLIRLFNTASRRVEEFFPLRPPTVTMYCCGPTVYDHAHIGNLRTYIWEDVLARTLLARGYEVQRVMNITDVGHLTSDADTGEDKIEKGARREGKSAWQIAEQYTAFFKNDLRALNCREPQVWCRATDHIAEMISLVKTLEEKGFTYRTNDGIYFDTAKFPRYSEFAQLDPHSLKAGARIDIGEKRNSTDFALWKFSPPGKKRQMEWESPWGIGFPGWHLECSAMAMKYLSLPIDIHCGGREHIRVHHTNEIAQSEAARGEKFVRYWVHGEWLMFESGKMSKSEGATLLLRHVVDHGFSPLAFRLFALSANYRMPLKFTWEALAGAADGLGNLKRLIAEAKRRSAEACRFVPRAQVEELLTDFWDALCDDLNTPVAIAALWKLVKEERIPDAQKIAAVERADEVLALDLLSPDEQYSTTLEREGLRVTIRSSQQPDGLGIEDIVKAVIMRSRAKKARDFTTADRIRTELAARGIELRDLVSDSVECVIKGRS